MKWLNYGRAFLFVLLSLSTFVMADSTIASQKKESVVTALIEHAHQMESRYEIPLGLVAAMCRTESNWRNVAGDQGRSIGVCQIQPSAVLETNANHNPYANSRQLYTFGSKGAIVAEIQAALVAAKYDVIVDGVFGRNTSASIRLFQRSAGLRVDGIVGPRTWAKLLPLTPYPGQTLVSALWDEKINIEWAARILRHRFEQCGYGSWAIAMAAYNGGCGNSVVVHTGRVLDTWKGAIIYVPTTAVNEFRDTGSGG